MALEMLDVRILGYPPNDNALLVVADAGQSRSRFLFDCGADTLASLSQGEIQSIDHLFLSHLHMDHISGFDAFFRVNFQRTNTQNHIWGPAGTARILQHRFQGFWWSHAAELSGTWIVHDIDESHRRDYRFEAREAFAIMHECGTQPHDGTILTTPEATVSALPLKHHGLCLGFVVRELDRKSIDMKAVAALSLKAGPWMSGLKDASCATVTVDGLEHDAAALRDKVMTIIAGDSIAYLTDFLADEPERQRLAPLLAGVKTLYAEAQYAAEGLDLANRYHHSTVEQIAQLAWLAGVGCYTLLHLSRRYSREQWIDMLDTARAIFPNSRFVDEWGLQSVHA